MMDRILQIKYRTKQTDTKLTNVKKINTSLIFIIKSSNIKWPSSISGERCAKINFRKDEDSKNRAVPFVYLSVCLVREATDVVLAIAYTDRDISHLTEVPDTASSLRHVKIRTLMFLLGTVRGTNNFLFSLLLLVGDLSRVH